LKRANRKDSSLLTDTSGRLPSIFETQSGLDRDTSDETIASLDYDDPRQDARVGGGVRETRLIRGS